ncbi:short-chain dehydrogenase [Delphinella strobiligena]|nr:short-chain dehydrogenase [Delphinella strobiligena]
MVASKVIVVTGASRGIGLAISHHLLSNQHKILAIARSQGPLEKLRQEYPSQVEILVGDLSDFSLGSKAAEAVKTKFGRLDGLIVNHGVLEPVKKISDVEVEDWRRLFDINVFSAVGIIKACLPQLRASQGRIVLCSSGAATGNYATWGAYGASKAALNHLAATLAVEEKEVTTVSIRPGVVDTDMQVSIRNTHSGNMDDKDAAKFKELKETGGLLRPDQPGNVMAKLAVDAPKDLSGKFLSWDDAKLSAFQDS